MKNLIVIIALTFICISCNETKKEKEIEKAKVKTEEVAANYKNIEVEIEGMTCEIGCARTIQSKLSKMEGVTFSKVDFESKKGQFTYDANKISQNDIVKKINGIAGGDLYSVTKTEELSEIKKDSIS
ncbi:MAG: heavy-metal-associated domain-containing protein [Bacteroidetes bacterium]|nr:heavy-metal-associated domain-containing protein [Bacteroidota bacterium]